jgi:teichuronic acid biosynthesis protein TuaE
LSSVIIERPKPDRTVLLAYLFMLGSFTLSAIFAADSGTAFERLRNFTLYTMLCWPVAAAVRDETGLRRLVFAFAICGALTFLTVACVSMVASTQIGFIPERQMREDNLPFLLPFLLCFLAGLKDFKFRSTLILSNGRAALVGLLVALIAYSLLVARVKLRTAMVIAIAILALAFLVRGAGVYRHATLGADAQSQLNTVTSYRSQLWINAFRFPPDNIWIGSGMGNIPESVLMIPGAQSTKLGHLHNFVLDCGYETGIAGLFTMLVFLSILLSRGIRNWRLAGRDSRVLYGTLLASSLAIMSNAMLSYSYTSKQFAIYLLVFAAISAKRVDETHPGN